MSDADKLLDAIHGVEMGRRVGWAKFYDEEERADRLQTLIDRLIREAAYTSVVTYRRDDADMLYESLEHPETSERAEWFLWAIHEAGLNWEACRTYIVDRHPNWSDWRELWENASPFGYSK